MYLRQTKKSITTLIVTFCLSLATGAFAQYPDDVYDNNPTYDGQSMALKQEKMELKKMLNNRLEQAENTLDYLNNQLTQVEGQLPRQQEQLLENVENSIEIYKTGLQGKIELISEQSGDEWRAFKRETKTWCNEIEQDMAISLKNIKEDYLSEAY